MRNFAQKIIFFSVWGIAIALFFSSCIDPIDKKKFFKDDKVQEKIERDRVGLVDRTGDSLRVGNKRITGLNPHKYYYVEELDEDENQISTRFVTSDGSLSNNPGNIGRVTDGLISGLDNNSTYIVHSASPLTGQMTRHDTSLANLPVDTGTKITAGANGITIPSPTAIHFLDLSPLIDVNTTDIYRSPVIPAGTTVPVTPISGNIIRLQGEGTETDYIFVDFDGAFDVALFKVLRVNINGQAPGDGLVVRVTFDIINGTPTLTPNTITVLQTDLINNSGTIPIINITSYSSNFNNNPVVWKYNNSQISTGGSLDLKANFFDDEEYWAKGVYIITVEVILNSNDHKYSGNIYVTVN
ncbi:MAG: hypothetical protein LBI28_14205 [Treponema sp.]|nr:hypothetical protein [Treponema sp.]